jgi:hypothetical protein
MTNIQKFTVKQINGDFILHKNDSPMPCAYRMPVMLPHPQLSNQAIIQSPLCGTNCQLFSLQNDIATFHCCNHSILLEKGTKKDGTCAAGTSDFLQIVSK